ncbi:MAG: DUF4159 domain-containing protein [Planctomycetes bacterium]|nr:DUF4159 domain-containing protein [Planctomycetota bacterium]
MASSRPTGDTGDFIVRLFYRIVEWLPLMKGRRPPLMMPEGRKPESFPEFLGEIFFFLTRWLHLVSVFLLGWLWVGFNRYILRHVPWSIRYGLAFTLFSVLTLDLGALGFERFTDFFEFSKKFLAVMKELGIEDSMRLWCWIVACCGLLVLPASFLAFRKSSLALFYLRFATLAYLVGSLILVHFILNVPAQLNLAPELKGEFDDWTRNDIWVRGVWMWLPFFFLGLVVYVSSFTGSAMRFYGRVPRGKKKPWGDRIMHNLANGGRDPRFRSSWNWSVFGHIFVLFIYPLIMYGCFSDSYRIPKGSGTPVAMMVKRVKPKKKPKEKFVLNMNSPILFFRPELEDSKIMEQVEEETQDTYQPTQMKGKLGKGGGKKGGWPNGMDDAVVRFIRLQYNGPQWDQDMGTGSDYNFLLKFGSLTGFKIAKRTESVECWQLKRFKPKQKPPFLYITGAGGMNMSSQEVKILRWYCIEEGGMIFADNGGNGFDGPFRTIIRRAFPELNWIDIANDDILYRQPYYFPTGAPPLWHHSGMRALGLKHDGRWIVFYHQGDINDAWKTGHSGAPEHVAEQAFWMGVNIVNYAFTNYLQFHYGAVEDSEQQAEE